jgi:hypothetical protein
VEAFTRAINCDVIPSVVAKLMYLHERAKALQLLGRFAEVRSAHHHHRVWLYATAVPTLASVNRGVDARVLMPVLSPLCVCLCLCVAGCGGLHHSNRRVPSHQPRALPPCLRVQVAEEVSCLTP